MAEAAVVAFIGLMGSVYSSTQQQKATKEAAAKTEAAAMEARAEELRILKETGPDQTTAGETIAFGSGDQGAPGSFSEFLVPKTSALGTTSSASGLGFNV